MEQTLNRRRLEQSGSDISETSSGANCPLTDEQVDQYLNVSTRTWTLNDEAFVDLENTLQSVIDCTKPADVVLFATSERITPAARIIVPWNLTISGAIDDFRLKDGVFPTASNRTIISCPDSSKGVFGIRSIAYCRQTEALICSSKTVLIANIAFDNCSFDASNQTAGIIEVEECRSQEAVDGLVALHHVGFTDNRLIGGIGLLMRSPSCYAAELIDVEFINNTCTGLCGALMGPANTIDNLIIEQNGQAGNGDAIPAMISASKQSTTTARNIAAQGNEGTVIFIEEGNVTLSNASFVNNSGDATSREDACGSCLHLVNASARIMDCKFSDNEGDLGGVMHAERSGVVIVDCTFEDNSAEEGGVFYATQRSRIRIHDSSFSRNSADDDGGVVHADDSEIVVSNSTFNRNSAREDGGCFRLNRAASLNLTSAAFTKNEAEFGGVLAMKNECDCVMRRCTFDANKAKVDGGAIHMMRSTLNVDACNASDGNATRGGVFYLTESKIEISQTTCADSDASFGGCLYAKEGSEFRTTDSIIIGNSAREKGGGMFFEDTKVTLHRSNVSSNSADDEGGGMLLYVSQLLLVDAFIEDNRGPDGAGMAAVNGSTFSIVNAHFEGNNGTYGAALLSDEFKNGSLLNCSFVDNRVVLSGGSIYIEKGPATIKGCRFDNGSADDGGFILVGEATVDLSDSSFVQGSSVDAAGCVSARKVSIVSIHNVTFTSCEANKHGGAIFISNSTLMVSNASFSLNKAPFGAGIAATKFSHVFVNNSLFQDGQSSRSGAGIIAEENGTLTVHNSSFLRNVANSAGAILFNTGTFGNVSHCIFFRGRVQEFGGAVMIGRTKGIISASIFQNNTSAYHGGSITVYFATSLEIQDSICLESKAARGGCIMCSSDSSVKLKNTTLANNSADQFGGGIDGYERCTLSLSNSTFRSNKASFGGGAIHVLQSAFEADGLNVVNNAASTRGGGIYTDRATAFSITNSNFTENYARHGGAANVINVRSATFRAVQMTKNFAALLGGCLYFENANSILLEETQFSGSRAAAGGTLYITQTSKMNITNSSFSRSYSAGWGGAIWANNGAQVSIQHARIEQARSATAGGGIFLQDAHLVATNLTVSDCRSGTDGGGIAANASSTLLCVDSTFQHNKAVKKGGAVSMTSLETQLLAYQFQDSSIFNNTAEFGGSMHYSPRPISFECSLGGLHFISPVQKVDCSTKEAICTFLALKGTRFEKNKASYAGGAIFTTDLNVLRLTCSRDHSALEISGFYTREQYESMNIIRSQNDLCSTWIENVGRLYGDGIATYATQVTGQFYHKTDTVSITGAAVLYVIPNHASGMILPEIQLRVADALGQVPAIGVSNDTIEAAMRSDQLLTGAVTKQLKEGKGTFSNIVVFQTPGPYALDITFSEDALQTIQFRVEIRQCRVGEKPISNGLLCRNCSATTYSFDPDESPCLPCPENANCASLTIRPEIGYWNPFPCSEHVQRCLTERACDYKGRDEKLDAIGLRSTSCSYDQATIEAYQNASCREGHKGPLCGSCRERFGKSQLVNCVDCLSIFGSIAVLLLSIVVLMALASFTIKSNLASFTRSLEKKRRRIKGQPKPSEELPTPLDDVEMIEIDRIEGTHRARDSSMGRDIELDASRKANLAKWKAVELFKIAVNFVQITAIAIAVNVKWSLLLVGLFEAADFLGGVTSEATNRSIDCLTSDSASAPRSIVSTVVILLIPLAVITLFACFWVAETARKGKTVVYFIERATLSSLAVFYISYISITKTLVNILSCFRVHDSEVVLTDHMSYYWAVDTSMQCYEGSHGMLASIVAWPLLILFSLLYPLTVAILILSNVREDYEEGWIYKVAGFLYRGYRKEFIFWESIVMLRKAALATIMVFGYPLGGNLQAILAIFVLTFALYCHTLLRPFRKDFDRLNEMEGISLLVSLVTFISSLFFDNERVSSDVRVAMTVVVFVLNVGLFAIFLLSFLIFNAKYLKAVLDREGVTIDPDASTVRIFYIYFFVYLPGIAHAMFQTCFNCFAGSRLSDGLPESDH